MRNLWLMIGHAVRQKVEGILVRSCACVWGRRCEYQRIYTAHRPIDFLRSTVAGGDGLSGTHGTHKDGPGGKSQTSPAKIYKIFRHELFTLCVAIQYFSVRVDDAKKN
jgi:hypothetical protein